MYFVECTRLDQIKYNSLSTSCAKSFFIDEDDDDDDDNKNIDNDDDNKNI